MSGHDLVKNDLAWRFLLHYAGVEETGMADEVVLAAWGFEARYPGDGTELWEDPSDPAAAGGLWVGKVEALRRVGVRARQGRTPPFAGGCP